MISLIYFGKTFGLSGNLRTLCSMGGAGHYSDFFKINWRKESWNLVFVLGAISGGWIANTFLASENPMDLAPFVRNELRSFGVENPGATLLPDNFFSFEALLTAQGVLILVIGGFLVGFGTRYAGGCTSGHAITGISNLQLPSLVATIGFFVGGLAITYLVLPWLLAL